MIERIGFVPVIEAGNLMSCEAGAAKQVRRRKINYQSRRLRRGSCGERQPAETVPEKDGRRLNKKARVQPALPPYRAT
jgi:hypothetical protein